jgi:hypothetical protein
LITGNLTGALYFDNSTGKQINTGILDNTAFNGSSITAATTVSDVPLVMFGNASTGTEVGLAVGSNTDARIHVLDSSSNTIYKFPAADGTTDQVLTTDGSGDLSWSGPTITLSTLKSVVAASSDFADFQSRIAAL